MDLFEIEVLGEKWKVFHETSKESNRFVNIDGYCDVSAREIHFQKYIPDDKNEGKDWNSMEAETLRHEIIHAFMYESGLWSCSNDQKAWAINEEMIDWMAIQFPKIQKVFDQVFNWIKVDIGHAVTPEVLEDMKKKNAMIITDLTSDD